MFTHIYEHYNTGVTLCKSIRNTKTLEVGVVDGTCFFIACIFLHYMSMVDVSIDLNTGEILYKSIPNTKTPKTRVGDGQHLSHNM